MSVKEWRQKNWRGSFAIPMTPYDDHDRIDEDALRAEIEFCIQAGTKGIVTPVMVSEFQALSEDERRLMVRIPVEQCAGRVPVVANCAAENTPLAVSYARYAEEVGADALIAMPPYALHPDFGVTYAYFKAIDAAVSLPIWIQNAGLAPLSADQIVRLCSELERVSWVKEEVSPPTHSISALMARQSSFIEGVMGGSGGRFMISEHARGSNGVIHACQFSDMIQRIWDLLDGGRLEDAGDVFEKILPGLVLEGLMGMAYAKEVMVRRGVLKNNRMRMESSPLDESDWREIDRTWERLQPHLLWHGF